MDTQPQFPGGASSAERPASFRPEDLQVGSPEQVVRPEAAPPVGPPMPSAPQNTGQPTAPPPAKLSRDDVMAAIAQTTAGPVVSSPGPGFPGALGTADDVDVIEEPWVNAAEQLVARHRGDPHGEEEAIEELNRDYLEKRYGYHVANPNGDSK